MTSSERHKHGRLLVIGGTTWLLDRAKAMGLEVFLIGKPQAFDQELARYADRTLLIDYDRDALLIPLLKAIHAETPFDACLTLTEMALLTAARINEELGLSGVRLDVVELTRDKYRMRDHLRQHGFFPVACGIGREPEDVRRFAEEHGFPLIVKPRDGVGSRGVLRVESREQAERLGADLLPEREFLMEEYLDGPEYSVEAFSFAGVHTVFAVTEKTTLPGSHIEKAHRMPAVLEPEAEAAVREHVLRFLTVLGLSDGPSHTEIKLTAKGPRVIETHTRLGGDSIPDLVQMSTGYDLRNMTLGWFTGRTEAVLEPKAPLGGAAIRFFTPEPGRVEAVTGVEEARCTRGVVRVEMKVRAGATIPELKQSRDRIGYVLAIGATAEEAGGICEEVERKVRFSMEKERRQRDANT